MAAFRCFLDKKSTKPIVCPTVEPISMPESFSLPLTGPSGLEERLPAGVYRQALAGFSRFAEASRHPELWSALPGRAACPAGLPEEDAVFPGFRFLADGPGLARRLDPRSLSPTARARPEELLDELLGYAEMLGERERQALEVLLVRALDPAAGLLTHPLERLFPPEEAAFLRGIPRGGEAVPSPGLDTAPGRGAVYRGYICVIAKLTRLCNLRCVYCHDWRSGPNQTMPFAVQAGLFSRLLDETGHCAVDVVWHGGEPTLLGKKGVLRILTLQQLFRRPGQRIQNILQTNATTLDDSWCALFARHGFKIGVSLDGPLDLHDEARPFVGGRPSSGAVREGLAALHRHGISPTTLLVVSRDTVALGARAIVRFLQDEGLTSVALLPVRPEVRDGAAVGPYLPRDEYVRFLLDVERERRESPLPWLFVRELDAAASALEGRGAGHCELLGGCVGSFFSVEPDGTVRHCDKYGDDPAFTLGNVTTQSFDEIRAAARTRALARANQEADAAHHASCRYYDTCKGWCPHERHVAAAADPAFDSACCGLAPLFEGLQAAAEARRTATPPQETAWNPI